MCKKGLLLTDIPRTPVPISAIISFLGIRGNTLRPRWLLSATEAVGCLTVSAIRTGGQYERLGLAKRHIASRSGHADGENRQSFRHGAHAISKPRGYFMGERRGFR
jgi:hypothetical protein